MPAATALSEKNELSEKIPCVTVVPNTSDTSAPTTSRVSVWEVIARAKAALELNTTEGLTEAARLYEEAAASEELDTNRRTRFRAESHDARAMLATQTSDWAKAAEEREASSKCWEVIGEHNDAILSLALANFYRATERNLVGELELCMALRKKAAEFFRSIGFISQADIAEGLIHDCMARVVGTDIAKALHHREEALRLMILGGDMETAVIERAAIADLKARIAELHGEGKESLQYRVEAARHFREAGQEKDAILEEAAAADVQARIATDEGELKAAISYRQDAARLFEKVEGTEGPNYLCETAFIHDLQAQQAQVVEKWQDALDHRLKAAELFEQLGFEQRALVEQACAENARLNILIEKQKDGPSYLTASAHARKAAELCRQAGEIGHKDAIIFEGCGWNLEARHRESLNDLEGTKECMQKSATLWRQAGSTHLADGQNAQIRLVEQEIARRASAEKKKRGGLRSLFRLS